MVWCMEDVVSFSWKSLVSPLHHRASRRVSLEMRHLGIVWTVSPFLEDGSGKRMTGRPGRHDLD